MPIERELHKTGRKGGSFRGIVSGGQGLCSICSVFAGVPSRRLVWYRKKRRGSATDCCPCKCLAIQEASSTAGRREREREWSLSRGAYRSNPSWAPPFGRNWMVLQRTCILLSIFSFRNEHACMQPRTRIHKAALTLRSRRQHCPDNRGLLNAAEPKTFFASIEKGRPIEGRRSEAHGLIHSLHTWLCELRRVRTRTSKSFSALYSHVRIYIHMCTCRDGGRTTVCLCLRTYASRRITGATPLSVCRR